MVDNGIKEFEKFSANSPSFDPDRRKFLKYAAVLAGLIASGQLLKACSTIQEPVVFQGKTYSNWEAYLMTQDLIRGPSLATHPETGLPRNSENHRTDPRGYGFRAVDYEWRQASLWGW